MCCSMRWQLAIQPIVHVAASYSSSYSYRAIGLARENVTGDPESCAHTVTGSLPSCSVEKPWVSDGASGKVTGIEASQEFPLAERVTPVMLLPSRT